MMHGQTEKIVYNREMKLTFAHTGNKKFVNFLEILQNLTFNNKNKVKLYTILRDSNLASRIRDSSPVQTSAVMYPEAQLYLVLSGLHTERK